MPDEQTGQTGTETQATEATSQQAGTETQAAEQQVGETQTFNYGEYVTSDGKLKEGWKNGLPEDLRSELSLNTFDSLPEAMRQLVGAQKMVGRDKVVIPTEKSTQAEWDAFYSKIGVPKDIAEYGYKAPDDLQLVDMSQEFVNPILSDLQKAGATPKVVQAAMGHFHNFMKNFESQIDAAEEQAFQEAEQKIQQSGANIEEDQHAANLLIANNCPDEEFKENLLEVVNDNALRPYLFNFLANVQRKYFGSHEGLPGGQSAQMGETSGTLRAKATEMQATPGYMDGTMRNTNPAQYSRLTKEISTLFNKADELEKQLER